MASSGCRARIRRSVVLLGLLAACGACTATRPQSTASQPASSVATTFGAGVELPAGPGRDILVAACLGCHELTALALFKGFYTRDSWRDLVLTMEANGAEVDGAEVEVLADYLAQHFGAGTP